MGYRVEAGIGRAVTGSPTATVRVLFLHGVAGAKSTGVEKYVGSVPATLTEKSDLALELVLHTNKTRLTGVPFGVVDDDKMITDAIRSRRHTIVCPCPMSQPPARSPTDAGKLSFAYFKVDYCTR